MLTAKVFLDGGKVKRLRLLAGLTQREVADRAGISPATVATLELRVRNERWHPQTLTLLAEALGVEPVDLIGED